MLELRGCATCAHAYARLGLLECAHRLATYRQQSDFVVLDLKLRAQQHSCTHMRLEGKPCGSRALLYQRAEVDL